MAKRATQARAITCKETVAEHQLLGSVASAGVEQPQDVEHPEDDRHHRQLYPDGGVVGAGQQAGPLERPQAVGGDGDRRGEGERRPEEAAGVLVEDGPVGASPFAQSPVLRRPLSGHHEQRAERRHHEEPARERHVRGHPAGDGPEHEAGGHRGELHDRLSLEAKAVGDGDGGIGAEDQGHLSAGQEEAGEDTGRHEGDATADGQGGGDGAGRHRTVLLVRVQTVGLGVDDVVDQVDARGQRAEEAEGGGRSQRLIGVVEHPGGGRGHEDQEVLRPLAGSHGDQQPAPGPPGHEARGRRVDR